MNRSSHWKVVQTAKQECLYKKASCLCDHPGVLSDSLMGSFCQHRLNLWWKGNGKSWQISKAFSWLKYRQRRLNLQKEKDVFFSCTGARAPSCAPYEDQSRFGWEGNMLLSNKASHNFALVGLVHRVILYEKKTLLKTVLVTVYYNFRFYLLKVSKWKCSLSLRILASFWQIATQCM